MATSTALRSDEVRRRGTRLGGWAANERHQAENEDKASNNDRLVSEETHGGDRPPKSQLNENTICK